MKLVKWIFFSAVVIGVVATFVSCTTVTSPSPTGGDGILFSITMSKSTLSLQVGQTSQFTATGKDQKGNTVNFQPTWTATGGIGSVTDGWFCASAVGTGKVIVTRGYVYSGCVSGEVIITVNPTMGAVSALSSIVVSPNTATIKVGAGQPFTAIGYDQQGNPIAITPVWSTTGGIGNITQSGKFTATNTGQGAVVATSGSISGQAIVTVEADDQNNTTYTPVLTSILVLPSSMEVFVGESVGFIAYGFDQNGYIMDFSPLWSTSGGIGTVSGIGVFTSTGEGTGKIRASGDAVYSESSITVSH